jgi:hypothetical protein
MTRKTHPLLLVLAALAFLAGIYSDLDGRGETLFVAFVVIAVALLLAYFMSQRQLIELASAGVSIRANTTGMSTNSVRMFINETEAAKNARYFARGIQTP